MSSALPQPTPAMAPLIWFLLALLLLAIAWLGADFDGVLPAALAGLLLSLLTAFNPALAIGLQLLLFAAASAALVLTLRHWSQQRREQRIPTSSASEQATVISGFGDGEEGGRVRWQGQSWAASNLEPQRPLPPGAMVVVMGRDGNRLQVIGDGPER